MAKGKWSERKKLPASGRGSGVKLRPCRRASATSMARRSPLGWPAMLKLRALPYGPIASVLRTATVCDSG